MKHREFFARRSTVVVLATLCCLLWGSAYPAIKTGYTLLAIAPADVPSKMAFAGYRFFFAGFALQMFALATGRSVFRLSADQWRQATQLGLLQTTVHYTVFYVGLAYTTGVKGSIINATTTFFSVLLAHFVYHNDRLSPARVIGCLIGFLGVLVVNVKGVSVGLDFTVLGEGFVALASLLFSAGMIYGKEISQKMDSVVLTGHQLAIGGLVLVLSGHAAGGTLPLPSFAASALMAFLVTVSAVSFVLWATLLKHNRVGTVAMFNLLIPIFGSVLSAAFLGENILEVRNALALLLVCAGIWLVTREEASKGAAPQAGP